MECPYDFIIFTDVRFFDELSYVKNLGGVMYKIIRPNIEKNEYSNHEAERGIDDEEFNKHIDNLIINNGNLKDLSEKIENIFRD